MDDDKELKAMNSIIQAVDPLEEGAKARVLRWAADRYGVALKPTQEIIRQNGGWVGEQEFADLAALYTASKPTTEAQKALVAGYWFQKIRGQADIDAQQVNTELKQLGHGIRNITDALSSLMEKKPQLVIQTRKSGASKQARKKYRLTAEGIRTVEQMLSEEPTEE